MGKPIALPDVTGVIKAIEIILDPAKSKEYAEALKSQIDEYQSLVGEYRKWKTLDEANASSAAKAAEASRQKEEAATILAEAKLKAESIIKSAVGRENDMNAKLREREAAVKAAEAAAQTSREEIKALRAEVSKASETARELWEQANRLNAQANTVKADYESRLEKLKGLAA